MNPTVAQLIEEENLTPADMLTAIAYAGGCWATDKNEPAEVVRSWKALTVAFADLNARITHAEEEELAVWVLTVFSMWSKIKAHHGW